jgi:hypothetical protein
MALFGLSLIDGRGRFGGDADEFKLALHPDDRHLADGFYELADKQDWFPVEYRIRRPDGTICWLSGGGQVVARSAEGKAQRLINVVADVTDRKVSEEHVKFLMSEITHRSKNLLSVVQAIASQTGRTVDTFEEFQKRFAQRLQGLAASHDLLVLQDWQGASLTDLVRDQLAPFTEPGSERITVSGPDTYNRKASRPERGSNRRGGFAKRNPRFASHAAGEFDIRLTRPALPETVPSRVRPRAFRTPTRRSIP